MLSLRLLSLTLMAISLSAIPAQTQAKEGTAAAILGDEQSKATRAALIGRWTGGAGSLKLCADGTFQIGDKSGRYEVRATTLVLTELGVNYTMYFASLSVVGLAIGFGSQGLVQDMVTGFFIVFEEQFNVGDMVEVPPHTGIVEELGLRMTRLRNYQGQRVTIPNRNIAVVGNYTGGAQQVYVDVAIGPKAEAKKASEVARQVIAEAADQFQGIIVSGPKDLGEISLSTGQQFIRVELAIWPQQQWVVDQELVSRIRVAMKSEGIEIPNDKIVVFYHPREKRSVSIHR